MKKSLTFFGLGLLLCAFIGFMFRLIPVPMFQGKNLWLVVFGLLGLVMIILSFVLRSAKKFLLWFGLGSLAYALLIFALRSAKVDNNVTLLIISLIVGFLLLIIGLVKRG
jgi:hypothetical protein